MKKKTLINKIAEGAIYVLFTLSVLAALTVGWLAFNVCVSGSASASEQQEVVIYTQDRCSACDNAKAYFRSKQIRYIEKNLKHADNVRQLTDQLGHKPTGTPEIFVNGQHVDSYREVR